MKKIILKIEGMSCSACQNRVEKYLNKQEGVTASVNLVLATASVEYDETKITIEDLNHFVEESGYKSLGEYKEEKETKKDNQKILLILYAFLTIFVMYVSMGHMIGLPVIPYLNMMKYPVNYGICLFLLSIPYLIYGFDILKSGIIKIIHKGPNMDSLVTIGVLASLFYSGINLIKIILGNDNLVEQLYFESVTTIIYFMKLGRYIDQKSKEKTKEAIQELVQITPESALIKTKKGEKESTIDEVKEGDILICKPGMKIAVDGTITFGKTHLEEAFITGESIPIKKKIQDKVIAGSINIDGYIEYRAEKIGPNSTISEIVRLVVEATNTKAPIGKVADKASGIFVPGIMIISLLTLIGYIFLKHPFHEAILSAVTVLVVACPCALGLATPLAIIVSEGKAAKKGIFVKSSETLENAHKVDTIVFDKTGTLTYGNLKISKVQNDSSYTDKELLKIISSIEEYSTHPVATAFKNWRKEHNEKLLEVKDFKNETGYGLSGIIQNKQYLLGNNKLIKKEKITNTYQELEKHLTKNGNSIIYVVEDKKVIALIGVKDIIRTNAKETIQKIKKQGIKTVMLSGDNQKTAIQIASSLKIDEVVADCLPKEKESYLKELKQKGHTIMMVGDGINDAPSLASSDIGISMNSGTDIAANSSDVLLMNDDLSKIVELIQISEKTIKIIKENLFWAFFYNFCMIPLAIGILKPWSITLSPMIASISMVISSLTVILNSLRLRK